MIVDFLSALTCAFNLLVLLYLKDMKRSLAHIHNSILQNANQNYQQDDNFNQRLKVIQEAKFGPRFSK